MSKRVAHAAAVLSSAVAASLLCVHQPAHATVAVEQIEAYEDASAPFTHYAAVDFTGSGGTKLVSSGTFNGITFHALDAVTNTLSSHASAVGGSIFGAGSVGNPYVTNVYSASADTFFTGTINGQVGVSNNGPVPGHFDGGAKVINNSYVAFDTSNLDTLRRLDFMINRDDVAFVASATNTGPLAGNYLVWSAFNSIAVRGDLDGFDPSGSPGKKHADLGSSGHTSFTAAAVSGQAVGLWGNAQAAGQTNAQHGVVVRSLIMAGADKTTYTRQTANNLDTQWGAGQPNYNASLAMLQAGEQPLLGVSGGNITGTITNNLKGWTFGAVTSGTQKAVIFHAADPIDGLTASLNWNVNSSQPTGSTIDTTNAGTIFPDLALELRPITFSGGQYVLGASPTDITLKSNATGASNDNVEYLYSTSILPAGDYAFLITGGTSTTSVGFSYSVIAPLVTQWASTSGGSWGNVAKWSNGIPNGVTARANFLASPGITGAASVTLDGNRTVGHITLNNANSYSINPGSGGALTIDDTGDGGGANPLITVSLGNHNINTPITLVGGLTVNATSSTSLNLSGPVTGSGGLTKNGTGALTLSGTNNYGDTTVNSGVVTLAAGASIASSIISVGVNSTFNVNGTLLSSPTVNIGGPAVVNFGGNTGTGSLTRNLTALNVGFFALAKLTTSAFAGHPAILSTNSLAFGDSSSTLDLTNNELITVATLSSIRSRIANGQIFTSISAGGGLGSLDLGSGQTEVRYTLLGDTNLDAKVDVTDLGNLAANYGAASGKVWVQGDTDYNGNVDISDLGNLAGSYGSSLAMGPSNDLTMSADALAASIVNTASSTVPEPTTLALSALLSVGGLSRFRVRRIR